MKRFSLAVCWTLAVALSATAAVAQDQTVELSLNECLTMALEHNLELVSARYNPQLAETDVTAQQGFFDVGLEASVTHNESLRVPRADFDLSESNSDRMSVGVAQELEFGADYSVSFDTTELVRQGQLVSESSISSGLNLGFNLPLLKGFGSSVATEQLVLAQNAAKVSRYDLRTRAELIIEQVEGAYWNVVAARRALEIEQLSLKRAEELLDLNRRKVEVGSLAPIEITQAEAGVASQEENVIVAETTMLDAEDELRRLMGVPEQDPMWEKSIINLDVPAFRVHEVDLAQTLSTAMRERSELFSLRQTMRDRELSEKVARRQMRNSLDLNASYSPQGSSPELDPFTFLPVTTANFGDAASAIFDGDEYTWQLGLTYRATFGNKTAKSNFARSRISREQAEVNLADQEQTIRVEVRRAVRAVESGMKRVEAAQANVILQRRKLDAEQKKYENGMSTSFEVLTFQSDLATAELAEVRARLDYIKALAAIERVKGTLMASRGLSLAG